MSEKMAALENDSLRVANIKLESVPEEAQQVSLPVKGSDTDFVDVNVFNDLKKRFKPSQAADKESFLRSALIRVQERLVSVDIGKLTDKDWMALGVPRDIGRMLVKL